MVANCLVTVLLLSSYAAAAYVPPFTRDVGASGLVRTSPYCDFFDVALQALLERHVARSGPLATPDGTDELTDSLVSGEAGSLGVEMALLGQIGRSAGCSGVGGVCRLELAGHLQQVRTDGIEPVVVGQTVVGLECVEEVEPGLRTAGHGDRNGVIQRDHRVVGELH
jgi:hypothetical protein